MTDSIGVGTATDSGGSARRLIVSEDEMTAWGEDLGRQLRSGEVLALTGELGSGKTTLVKAICRGYGVSETVTSPTFAIIQVYRSPSGSVHHIDLYRLRNARECADLGLSELFFTDTLVIVEWPERGEGVVPVPPHARWINLSYVPGRTDVRELECQW